MTTSRGSLLERLFQIGALECTISHDVETLQFFKADSQEIENTIKMVDNEGTHDTTSLKKQLEDINFQIEKRKDIIKETTELRRELMSTLEDLNDRDWCSCKHYAEVVSRSLEIYCSTWSDKDYEHLIKAHRIWAMRLSLYFNLDYTTCFRCLSDHTKGA